LKLSAIHFAALLYVGLLTIASDWNGAFSIGSVAYGQGRTQANPQSPARGQSAAAAAAAAAGTTAAARGSASEALVVRAKLTETELYLQGRIREAISGLLTTPYSLTVRIQVDNTKLRTMRDGIRANRRISPADADRLYLATIEQLSPLGFLANIKSKVVYLIVDATTKEDTLSALRDAVSKAVDLVQARGDKLDISMKDLSAEESPLKRKLEEITKERNIFESDLRSTKNRLDAEVDNSRTLEVKMQGLEQENRKLITELERLRGVIDDLQRRVSNRDAPSLTPFERFKNAISGFEIPITMLALGLLLMLTLAIGSFIEGRRIKKRMTSLQDIVTGVSGSFETIGASIIDAAKVFNRAQEVNTEDQELEDVDDGHVDVLERQAAEAWQALQEKRSFVLEVLKDWLADRTKRSRFLRVCEAVGTNESKTLWDAFPKEETNQLAPMLDRPMTRAQAFKSVLLLGRFVARMEKSRPAFFGRLDTTALARYTDEKLAQVLTDFGTDAAASIMTLLSPDRMRRVLGFIRDLDSRELLNLTHARRDFVADDAQELLTRLSAGLDSEPEEATFDVTEHFATILEHGSRDSRRAAMESLKENPELQARVQRQVLTFDAILKMDPEILREQIEDLEPEEIAALAMSIDAAEGRRIVSGFSGKLLFRIQSEMNRLQRSVLGRRRAEKAGEKLQRLIVGRVRKLVDEGVVELNESGSPAAGSGQAQLPRAS
jgi:hypothetical protein